MRTVVTFPSQTTRSRVLLVLAAFTLMLVATLSLVGHRASAADLQPSATASTTAEQTAEQTETTEDGTPAATPAWAILERLNALGLLPEQATLMMRRAVLEHVEARYPGRACERILQAGRAAPQVIERCRAALADAADPTGDQVVEPEQVCRRALQTPAAVQSLIERCRAWAANTLPGSDSDAAQPLSPTLAPAEACRRIASADEPIADLVERCRLWLSGQADSGTSMARELCARILAADAAPESLIERCEALAGSSEEVERPTRPERPALPERPGRR